MAKPTTSRAQQPWQDHPLVEELLVELQAIEERMQCAVRLHTLMNQRCPLEIPVQYERLFLHSPARKEEKNMTIEEVLQKATEGGYHLYGSDGMETDYGGANSEYSVWNRKDNASSFIVPVADTFLDPISGWRLAACAGVGADREDSARRRKQQTHCGHAAALALPLAPLH